MEENVKAVAEALQLLGTAYRMDWSDFDGRTLRSQLDDLAGCLTSGKEFDIQSWAAGVGICPVNRSWDNDCPERGPGRYSCKHTVVWKKGMV